ncbi:MAG: hypothetical protein ACE5MB_07165 [Anaerolineae bacterium]
MDPATLAMWRNGALLLLFVEAFAFSLPLLVALFFAIRGLRQLRARIVPYFPVARGRVSQVERVTVLVSRGLVMLPIQAISLATGLLRGLQVVVGGRRG